jgi:hypothetical protein
MVQGDKVLCNEIWKGWIGDKSKGRGKLLFLENLMAQESNSFFDELKEWSERKLNLLRKYIESATKILGSIDPTFMVKPA